MISVGLSSLAETSLLCSVTIRSLPLETPLGAEYTRRADRTWVGDIERFIKPRAKWRMKRLRLNSIPAQGMNNLNIRGMTNAGCSGGFHAGETGLVDEW